MVDLVTNQKLLWKQEFLRDDGRNFDSSPLEQSDEAELAKEVREARMSLIEQVRFGMLNPTKTQHLGIPSTVYVCCHRSLTWTMSLQNCC